MNKYGTTIEKQWKLNQALVQEHSIINNLKNVLEKYNYNKYSLVFTDKELAKVVITNQTVIPYFYVENEGDILKERIELDIKALERYLKMNKGDCTVIMNPPYDGTLHLKLFNAIKKHDNVKGIICIHPTTQLEALPRYKNGECEEFESYYKEGVAEQITLSFDNFVHTTDAYGDIAIDVYDNVDKWKNSSKNFVADPWSMREDCYDKELYKIVYNAIENKLEKTNDTLEDHIVPFGKNTEKYNYKWFLCFQWVKSGNRTGSKCQFVADIHREPYDVDGLTLNTSSLLNNSVHISERYWCKPEAESSSYSKRKGMIKWNNGEFKALAFSNRDNAIQFLNSWSSLESKMIINCVTHNQKINTKLIPYTKEDIVKFLGLEKYRDRILEEANKIVNHRTER